MISTESCVLAESGQSVSVVLGVIRVRYSEGPLFRRSAILKVYYSHLTLRLTVTVTLTLTLTLALWRVSAQWIFGIADLRNSAPVPLV